jgi:hypothetical protein
MSGFKPCALLEVPITMDVCDGVVNLK